ncbi:MAG: sulfate adenylyltransferase, partial [Myxococcales bacterium]|nr:sulfate adenylyltransferase [Myxococcales bacterium]
TLEAPSDTVELVVPHGGTLVDRVADPERAAELRTRAPALPRIELSVREVADLELIAVGALSPLDGFMCRASYERVVGEGRLASGLPWTIPVTLSVARDVAARLARGTAAALYYDGTLHALLTVEETFARHPREARNVYGTDDPQHPGVAQLLSLSEVYVGGTIELIEKQRPLFSAHHYEPRQTRAYFRDRGWQRIAAFQTRNPIHRAHEYLTKVALEVSDGLLIHPLVGYTKDDDIPAAVRMRSYEALIERYYPKERVLLATLPAAMRYAGPKEAIFHALVRKNYGCTHFIVGRDHAGVGSYYDSYDAQREFDRYTPEELGITPLRFESAFYCGECAAMASAKSCPHAAEARVSLSGTRIRDMLAAGQEPPPEVARPEVARILIDAMKSG